jgi:hypothetical protein
MGGEERRQRLVSRLSLVDWTPRSGIWTTENRKLVRLRAGEPPEDG